MINIIIIYCLYKMKLLYINIGLISYPNKNKNIYDILLYILQQFKLNNIVK